MAFNNKIRAASGFVPPAIRASTGRQWYLHQDYSSATFAALNRAVVVVELLRNPLQTSSPSFLHRYHTKRSSYESLGPGNKRSRKRKVDMDAFDNELSKIVGLHELKLQLRKWAQGMVLDENRRALGLEVGPRRPPHMAFLGNPGTGKTMVARLMGKLMHMVGILSKDKVVEVQRTDLVAKWIGETGPKTTKKIADANGGILFVDEAYRLMPEDSRSDFGIQALEEIMSFMDKRRMVVIFAGYSKPMERVISANEGFRRRVTKFFHFDDFSCEDLAKILHLKMSSEDENSFLYGFKLHPSCSVEAVAAMIERETTERQRKKMNGGLVDTVLVNAKENLDSRIDVECKDTDSLLTITLEDLEAGLRLLTKFAEQDKRRKWQD